MGIAPCPARLLNFAAIASAARFRSSSIFANSLLSPGPPGAGGAIVAAGVKLGAGGAVCGAPAIRADDGGTKGFAGPERDVTDLFRLSVFVLAGEAGRSAYGSEGGEGGL